MIKIKNVYWMLVYAYMNTDSKAYEKLSSQEFEDDNIYSLLAELLIAGINYQIKKGLSKEYILYSEQLSTLRGKININDTIKCNSLIYNKAVCEYDEYTINSYMNRIIKTALKYLLKCEHLDKNYKEKIHKILRYFCNINELNYKSIDFKRIRYNQNNISYKLSMVVCELIFKDLLFTTENGKEKFKKVVDEKRYHKLFEDFVKGYYKRHYKNLNAGSMYINWDLDEKEKSNIKYLPNMKTDITLNNQDNGKVLIIDTKFYSRIIARNDMFDSETYKSNNIYQIYSYVKNRDKDKTGKVSGMLLYAKTDEDIDIVDADFKMSNNKISIRVIDLNKNFKSNNPKEETISGKLDELLEFLEL